MKRLLLSAIIIAGTVVTAAAQVRTAYFMEGTTYRSQFNPAFAPTMGYVNFPLVGLGGLNFNLDGTLSVNDLLKKRPDGKLATIFSSAFSQKEAFSGLNKSNNSFNLNTNINLIGFGAYAKNHKTFWSVDANLHLEAAFDIPFDFFDFARNISTNGKSSYDFSKFQLMTQAYMDVGFNYSMPITDKLYVGARAKFLVGLARANANITRFDLDLNENHWNVAAQAEMDLYLKGATVGRGGTIDDMKIDGIPVPSGYGFAVDLGATYNVLKNLQVSLAVNDIGFISWANRINFKTDEAGIDFSGMGIDIYKDETGKVTTSTSGTDLSFDNLNLNASDIGKGGRATSLRATINAGVEYDMWNHRVGFGLLYHARVGLYKSSHNLTASVNYHPCYWFTLSPSYTFNNNSGGAVGLALNLSPRGFNFFLATDLLLSKLAKPYFIPYKQDRMTFTLGMGFNIGRRGYRIAEYASKWQQKEQNKLDKRAAKKRK